MAHRWRHAGLRVLGWVVLLLAAISAAARAVEPQIIGWNIEGEKRAAIVYAPTVTDKRAKAPLIFVFHGHGDNAWFATEQFPFQKLWPEAIVVFPQGLPRASSTDPRGERRGWQHEPGEFGDRDLKLFDAMLRTVRGKFRVDEQRIYATGFSNGGFFDYLLWAQRPKVFAAFAPCAAALRPPVCAAHPSRSSRSRECRIRTCHFPSSIGPSPCCGRSTAARAKATRGAIRGPSVTSRRMARQWWPLCMPAATRCRRCACR